MPLKGVKKERYNKMYYAANNQKIADKKKADYREGLEKSRTDSAAQSCESYKKDLEKSCDDSAAWHRESYLKDPGKPRKLHEGSGKESC